MPVAEKCWKSLVPDQFPPVRAGRRLGGQVDAPAPVAPAAREHRHLPPERAVVVRQHEQVDAECGGFHAASPFTSNTSGAAAFVWVFPPASSSQRQCGAGYSSSMSGCR